MARKTHNDRLSLPPLELECMKVLWALGAGTVHEIRQELLAERPLAYTTVLTLMDRLARKGIVEREKRGRAHLYRPSVPEDRIRQMALARLVRDFFAGSREQLRQYLAGQGAGQPRQPIPSPAGAEAASSPQGPSEPQGTIDPTLL